MTAATCSSREEHDLNLNERDQNPLLDEKEDVHNEEGNVEMVIHQVLSLQISSLKCLQALLDNDDLTQSLLQSMCSLIANGQEYYEDSKESNDELKKNCTGGIEECFQGSNKKTLTSAKSMELLLDDESTKQRLVSSESSSEIYDLGPGNEFTYYVHAKRRSHPHDHQHVKQSKHGFLPPQQNSSEDYQPPQYYPKLNQNIFDDDIPLVNSNLNRTTTLIEALQFVYKNIVKLSLDPLLYGDQVSVSDLERVMIMTYMHASRGYIKEQPPQNSLDLLQRVFARLRSFNNESGEHSSEQQEPGGQVPHLPVALSKTTLSDLATSSVEDRYNTVEINENRVCKSRGRGRIMRSFLENSREASRTRAVRNDSSHDSAKVMVDGSLRSADDENRVSVGRGRRRQIMREAVCYAPPIMLRSVKIRYDANQKRTSPPSFPLFPDPPAPSSSYRSQDLPSSIAQHLPSLYDMGFNQTQIKQAIHVLGITGENIESNIGNMAVWMLDNPLPPMAPFHRSANHQWTNAPPNDNPDEIEDNENIPSQSLRASDLANFDGGSVSEKRLRQDALAKFFGSRFQDAPTSVVHSSNVASRQLRLFYVILLKYFPVSRASRIPSMNSHGEERVRCQKTIDGEVDEGLLSVRRQLQEHLVSKVHKRRAVSSVEVHSGRAAPDEADANSNSDDAKTTHSVFIFFHNYIYILTFNVLACKPHIVEQTKIISPQLIIDYANMGVALINNNLEAVSQASQFRCGYTSTPQPSYCLCLKCHRDYLEWRRFLYDSENEEHFNEDDKTNLGENFADVKFAPFFMVLMFWNWGGQTFCSVGRIENYFAFEGPHMYFNSKFFRPGGEFF
ncbi:hypothetical protein HELRODRAFT_182481 [Helobdella robusta]|uniref:UBA domain-containing protein n=1 Tax=Helobdella robusta TaxID=6412 RepID=T1FI93_HELRO|nr:hypothetical protein HELRODRAFT_182481 [Helobdella robusta]ESN90898.1 hypothetical protein HELRODRAFT_182481 [Helobdella robusta]